MKTSCPASLVQLFFRLLLGASAAALAVRTFTGSFSPLNAESFIAISFVILMWFRSHAEALQKQSAASILSGRDAAVVALIAACTVISFAGTLRSPLIFDDYTHVDDMAYATWRGLMALFTIPSRRIFFRPVGFISYWLDYKWAGRDPFRWHLASLAIHVVNSGLMYVLLRQLRMTRLAAGVGALVFAIHASRAEAVSWTDARFDLLSTLFVILCLVVLNRYLDTNRVWLFLLSILSCALAIFAKEAAFCLPLLALCLIPFRDKHFRSRLIRAAFCLISSPNRSRLVAAVAFVIASALPVAHLLLIGADMNGSRLLYLPVARITLLWGVLIDGPQSLRARLLLGAGLVLFQAAALQHNPQLWRSVPMLARATGVLCVDWSVDQAGAAPSAWHSSVLADS